MSLPVDKKTIQELFDSLKIIQKATEDDFELRRSADEKVWGVRMFDDDPSKPTFVLYAGPEAKELACDAADYDLEDDEDKEGSAEEEDDEDEDEEEEE